MHTSQLLDLNIMSLTTSKETLSTLHLHGHNNKSLEPRIDCTKTYVKAGFKAENSLPQLKGQS